MLIFVVKTEEYNKEEKYINKSYAFKILLMNKEHKYCTSKKRLFKIKVVY